MLESILLLMSKSRSERRSTTRRRVNWNTATLALALLVVAGAVAWRLGWLGGGSAMVSVRVPELSRVAAIGETAFDESCVGCHGARGSGSDQGPPLIHDIYNPGHHADSAFYAAAKRGVGQHHWRFGNMPAQPQVSGSQMTAIIRYVRELQRANGITYRPHRM
jgi:mono/diheme cytochrome c family protein